ncbi:MAG: PAS domain S-box protein [Symploca sp. SIO1C2]|nr:PAS domain S-box protein [Symploca sp. SIO1C2]
MVLAAFFLPHGHCYLWKPGLLGLHLISDGLTALAYYSIPLMLLYFVYQRRDIPFNRIFQLFSVFIFACGTTHVLEIWTLWHPSYWLSGSIKAVTAVVSIYTAISLFPLIPQALALPSLETANQRLEQEVKQRQQTEETLRESEQCFRLAFNDASIGMALVSPDGHFLEVNKALCRIVGYSEEELLGKTFQEITHPDDLQTDLDYVHQVLAGEILTYQMEKRYFHCLGHIVWILLSVSLVRDEHNEPLYFIAQIQEITQRKHAEQLLKDYNRTLEARVAERTKELQQKEQFLRGIYEGVEAAIFVVDVLEDGEFRFVGFNLTHERMSGLRSSELRGKTPKESLSPEVAQAVLEKYRACVVAQERISYEEGLLLQGKETWWITNLTPLWEGNTKLLGNPVDKDKEDKGDKGDKENKGDKEQSLSETSSNSRIYRLIGTSFNITDRKQVEIALEEALKAADAANRAKSQFIANMSHELRTPLNAVLGFTQLLSRDTSLTSHQHEQLGIINRSGEHLLGLINDILEMSKIEAGISQLHPNQFNLYLLLKTLEDMLQIKAEAKDLPLVFNVAADVPQYIEADESKLRQVLVNLLGNAVKFTVEGRVSLRVGVGGDGEAEGDEEAGGVEGAEGDGEMGKTREIQRKFLIPDSQRTKDKGQRTNNKGQTTIFFEVEDTGYGIAADELEHIFEAFVQTDIGRQSQQGTGLGLAISQRFVELMGGKLTVNSTLGQGTTFRFKLPVTLAQTTGIAQQHLSARIISLAPTQTVYRILVVEDRWESRYLLVKLLEKIGFEVMEAANGKEAVDCWEDYSPHLIFMDMRMPVLDGYQATRQIKAHLQGQAVVIIALTASAFEEERGIIMAAGCDDFIRKPFRETVLLEKIAKHLGVQYLYEENNQQSPHSAQLTTNPNNYQFSAENLLVMSIEWRSQLHRAALIGDSDEILVLIEQIPEPDAELKFAIADLVDNFQLEVIIDLTKAWANE